MKYLATAITNSVMWLCSTAIILYVLQNTGSLLSLLLIFIPAVCTVSHPYESGEKKETSE